MFYASAFSFFFLSSGSYDLHLLPFGLVIFQDSSHKRYAEEEEGKEKAKKRKPTTHDKNQSILHSEWHNRLMNQFVACDPTLKKK